jgi:hypothetical protein
MAKSKEQKRQEALARLEKRLEQRSALQPKRKPSFAERVELDTLRHGKRPRTTMEQLFGAGDPVTGMIYADPLPWNYHPTSELANIVNMLSSCTERFVEVQVSLETPEGCTFPTYEGSGTYLHQWVARHTSYVLHHSKHLYGTSVVAVFSREHDVPHYDNHDSLVSGVTQEMYDQHRY